MPDNLYVGSAIQLKNTFTVSDVKTDPTTVTLEVKDPSGNTDTYTYSASITKNSTGVYSKTISFDEAGMWRYEWQGTGTCIAVASNSLLVKTQLI
jgi:hypothetical protein